MKFKGFKPLIKTKRLELKPMPATFEMAHTLYELIDRNRKHFKYLPIANVKAVEEEFTFLQNSGRQWKMGDSATYGMYLRGTDTFIGMVNIHAISWASARGEFGYWMDSKYTGQGLMTEAVVALETYFFKMGFNRLAILANPKNKASVAIARRLGYVKEGTERARNYNQYMKEYEDLTIFSKLRSEWKK